MIKAYLYIVTASPEPDSVDCPVPYCVDEDQVFFGPCKKRLREELRQMYMAPNTDCAKPTDDIYVIGFNGSNLQRIRKVIWAGRVNQVMTFGYAYSHLTAGRYAKMRGWNFSPLHVKPIINNGRLIGYEHINEEHKEGDAWIGDLIKSPNMNVVHVGNRILLQPDVSPWAGFPRDVCFLLENIFFAQGKGIDLDERCVVILQDAQPDRRVDEYAIFGYRRDGSVDGRTGSYLTLDGLKAQALIHWIYSKVGTEKAQTRFRDSAQARRGGSSLKRPRKC